MDCEKFEPLLLDELYGELDELTSAAVKRHVATCARCSGILSGLSSTRSGIAMPIVPVPEGLEERILAAAREAQKVVPIRSPLSRAISAAGSWAMRPQTAMAAVFLLMLGTSAVLVKSRNRPSSDSAVSVTVAGEPAPTAAPSREALDDDKAAAAAHGPSTPPNVARPPAPVVAAVTEETAKGKAAEKKDAYEPAGDSEGLAQNYAAPGSPPAKSGYARSGPTDQQDPSALGAAAFRARNYAEAAKQYDVAAQGGDLNAELWAAESVKQGQGCAVALGRLEKLAQKAPGQWVGSEASYRAARCQMEMGQAEAAKEKLNKLAQVPSHQQQAQSALADAAGKPPVQAGPVLGGVAAPKRAAAPAPAPSPAKPAAATNRAPNSATEQQQRKGESGY